MYMNAGINRGTWAKKEDDILIEKHREVETVEARLPLSHRVGPIGS
jgi:hypothetical protein